MSHPNLPRTKVVCTLGPATDAPGVLDAMIEAGMSVARINFSHGTRPDHVRRIDQVREAAARSGATVAVLADLQGPKFRIGDVAGGHTRIEPDSRIVLTTRPVPGDSQGVTLPHADLVAALRPGERLLLDDGLLELRVE